MFSSNQKLLITGDNDCKEQIENAISLLLNGFDWKPNHYYISEDGYFHFASTNSQFYPPVEDIEKEDRNVGYLTKLVELYLESAGYERTLKEMNIPEWYDGSYYSGWCMEVDMSEIGSEEIIIKPAKAFYHK